MTAISAPAASISTVRTPAVLATVKKAASAIVVGAKYIDSLFGAAAASPSASVDRTFDLHRTLR